MLLTVFTPAYNRSATITRLFDSLMNQSFTDFEWLIVDDGSTDDTEETVKAFDTLGKFNIRYIKKENGGKHTAYNIGLSHAKGLLFFNVDSDDWLHNDSLLQISRLADLVFNRPGCAGIIALKSFADQSTIGSGFITDNSYHTFRELELSGQGGERSIVFLTQIARKHRFPEIEGERFMPEGVVYDQFSLDQFYIYNKSLTICEYQTEGLSSNPKKLMVKNPGGYMLYYRKRIDMAQSFKERLSYILRYNFFRSIYRGNTVQPYKGKHSLAISIMRIFNPIVAKYY